MYQNNNGQYQQNQNQYYYAPAQQPIIPSDPEADAYVDAAFSKSLAATIMCSFPVASIIAIFFGSAGLDLVEKAKYLAAQRGVRLSGKNIAATILGKIGKIAGIVMTAFWGFYFFVILLIFLNLKKIFLVVFRECVIGVKKY